MDQEFFDDIKDLLASDAVQRLKRYVHHKSGTRFDHSLYVAYRSYRFAKKMGWDSRAAARGGLLHDLFFYDWRDDDAPGGWHVTEHPVQALREAEARFDLSDMEKDIIVKHMWPLSPWMPKYRESFTVSMMDKYCAMMECLFLGQRKMRRLGLAKLAIKRKIKLTI